MEARVITSNARRYDSLDPRLNTIKRDTFQSKFGRPDHSNKILIYLILSAFKLAKMILTKKKLAFLDYLPSRPLCFDRRCSSRMKRNCVFSLFLNLHFLQFQPSHKRKSWRTQQTCVAKHGWILYEFIQSPEAQVFGTVLRLPILLRTLCLTVVQHSQSLILLDRLERIFGGCNDESW
jgi:hypothetical protein